MPLAPHAGLAPSRYFEAADFACHDGTPYPAELSREYARLVPGLCDHVRAVYGTALYVVSGYRTAAYNARLVAGSPHHDVASASQHVLGNAADLRPHNPSLQRVKALHDAVLASHARGELPSLGGLGLYDGWIHVDTFKAADGHLRRWDSRTAAGRAASK